MVKNNENPSLLHYWGNTPEEDYYSQQGITSSKSFYTSPTGQTLFTRSWHPLPTSTQPPRALIFMVHGYSNDISWTFQSTPIYLAQNGFSCFALDLPGHGNSHGLRAFVPNVDVVVDDCISFFNFIKGLPQYQGLPSFLYGESMGGAICLLIHLKNPSGFKGRFFPTLPIVPTADLLEKSVRVPEKRIIGGMNPLRYSGKPRLGTVIELLRITDYLNERLKDVSLPFVVLHGSADVVTDPNVSRALYDAAKTQDKTLKIYDGMLHSLVFGDTDENLEIVRRDILAWLDCRCRVDTQ